MMPTFRAAQVQALLAVHFFSFDHGPIVAAPYGSVGADWHIVPIGHPDWIINEDPMAMNPDMACYVVRGPGDVLAFPIPVGPYFEGLREVTGEVITLETALAEG